MESQIVFENFDPPSELSLTCHMILDSLMDDAPSDATLIPRMKQNGSGYVATIEIFSMIGNFKSSAIEKTPLSALNTAKQRIESQLLNWKRHRHLNELSHPFVDDFKFSDNTYTRVRRVP